MSDARAVAILLGRRIPGNRTDFRKYVNPPSDDSIARYVVSGDYDFGLIATAAGDVEHGIRDIRRHYSSILDDGFDARVTVGFLRRDAAKDERGAAPQPLALRQGPLCCITLVRISEAFVRAKGTDGRGRGAGQLAFAQRYLSALVAEVRRGGPALVLPLFDLLDFAIVQTGTSYNDMYDAVRLVRSSTLGHVLRWARRSQEGGPEPMLPPGDGGPALANHLCVSTYTVLGFRWDVDENDLRVVPAHLRERAPPVPVSLIAYNPGHEQRGAPGIPHAGATEMFDTVGLFDRSCTGQIALDGQAAAGGRPGTEAQVIAGTATAIRSFLTEEARPTLGEDFYGTNTIWQLKPVTDEAIREIVAGTSFDEEFPAPIVAHRHLVGTAGYTCRAAWDELDVLREGQRAPVPESIRRLLLHLRRVYQAYDLLVNNDFLFPTVDDLHPFLLAFVRALGEVLDGDDVARLERPLRVLITDLSACLHHRHNFTTFSFKAEMSFLDSSAMHKVQRMLGAVARRMFRTLEPWLKKPVKAFVYAGAVSHMESTVLLEAKGEAFVAIRIGADDLFRRDSVYDLVHEVAHFLFFVDFNVDDWLLSFLASVSLHTAAACDPGRGPAAPFSAGLSGDARKHVADIVERSLAAAVRSMGPADFHEAPGLLGAVRKAAAALRTYLKAPSFGQRFLDQLRRDPDVNKWLDARKDGADRPTNADALVQVVDEMLRRLADVYTEAIPDIISAEVVTYPRYLARLERAPRSNIVALYRQVEGTVPVEEGPDEPLVRTLIAVATQMRPRLLALRDDLQLTTVAEASNLAEWHAAMMDLATRDLDPDLRGDRP